eukprot:TRINITY_DN60859_c0_g1_i1.p1 TRINITY_DN60859_c0_g1~~TRINITY_DN60859_c0_g1_i1.p1  ORF type:complete len:660 (+),score=132.55 TRINITY_DN60859_c0_g1_i1:150-2129(+)
MQDDSFQTYDYVDSGSADVSQTGGGDWSTVNYDSFGAGTIAPDRIEGICAQWNEKGYGFIHFSDGRRAYVHNSQCKGEHLVVGEAVTCYIVPDEKNPGKLQAESVERLNPELANQFRAVAGITLPSGITIGMADVENSAAAAAAAANEAWAADVAAAEATAAEEAAAASALTGDLSFGFPSTSMGSLTDATDLFTATMHTPQQQSTGGSSLTITDTPPVMDLASIAGLLESATDGVASSTRLEGIVTRWNERGFGFIEFSEGRRAYVHHSQCGGVHLMVGETVSATLVVDHKNAGKLAAHDVKRGPLGEDGVVSEWREESGYGYMAMDDGRRAYVHASVLNGSTALTVGQRLRVLTKPDSRNAGKWCVVEIKAEHAQAPESVATTRSANFSASTALQIHEGVPPQMNQTAVSQAYLAGAEADGTVTKWKEDGGYGFLSMDDGRRIYIHRNVFGGVGSLVVGQRLRVTTKLDPRNPGKWCVEQVKGELQEEEIPVAESNELENYKAAGLSLEAASNLAAAVAAGGTAAGNSWDELFGAGAYAAALNAAAQNVLGTSALAGGDASVVSVATPPPPDLQDGVVAEWHEANGYGFLTMDDGRRVYVHRNSFGGSGSLVLGSRMQVTVKPDPRNPGKWSVDQVIAGDIVMLADGGGPAKRARQS